MITGSLHVWPSSVERWSRMFAEPELAAVAGVPAYAARNVPREPPLGVQPIPVWLPVPVKTGGPSGVTDHPGTAEVGLHDQGNGLPGDGLGHVREVVYVDLPRERCSAIGGDRDD